MTILTSGLEISAVYVPSLVNHTSPTVMIMPLLQPFLPCLNALLVCGAFFLARPFHSASYTQFSKTLQLVTQLDAELTSQKSKFIAQFFASRWSSIDCTKNNYSMY